MPTGETNVFAVLARAPAQHILSALKPGDRSTVELQQDTLMSKRKVNYHVSQLIKAGFVSGRRLHREFRYSLSKDGFAAVQTWLEDFTEHVATSESIRTRVGDLHGLIRALRQHSSKGPSLV